LDHKLVNFEVSVQRAEAVASHLIAVGVPKNRILVTAASDSEPIYYEFMPSGEAGNRRTEIFLDY
jgi:flagellar motor protein MotB